MKNYYSFGLIFIGIFIFFVFSGAFYIINETEQVIITQFGKPIGEPILKAGLYFKWPWQTANYYEKRILKWDGDPNQIPTLDKRYIFVDTTARWRIQDPLKFRESVGNIPVAMARLDDVIDAATRDAISSYKLVETIRNSNRLIEEQKDKHYNVDDEEDMAFAETTLDHIKVGREQLSRMILSDAQKIAPNYGIEIVDVRIKRINYVQDVQKKVFERMISERNRAAEHFRSEGQGKKAEIEGQTQKDLNLIRSEAYRQAQEIKGKADAEATKIYAEAYNQDKDFYAFLRTLEAYERTIDSATTLIFGTNNEFYRYLDQYRTVPEAPILNITPP